MFAAPTRTRTDMHVPVPAFLERAFAQRLRSTALQPLQWVLAPLIAATIAGPLVGAPVWLEIFFAGFTGLGVIFFGGCYVFFMRKNPDALRSERYTLSKMQIERGLLGDSAIGLIDPDELASAPALPAEKGERLESGQ
jgi:hypothetical protein